VAEKEIATHFGLAMTVGGLFTRLSYLDRIYVIGRAGFQSFLTKYANEVL
jgi:hypothetical protein